MFVVFKRQPLRGVMLCYVSMARRMLNTQGSKRKWAKFLAQNQAIVNVEKYLKKKVWELS